jgi:acetyl esterase
MTQPAVDPDFTDPAYDATVGTLSPATRDYLAQVAQRFPTPVEDLSLAQARENSQNARWRQREPEAVAAVVHRFHSAPTADLPVRLYYPAPAPAAEAGATAAGAEHSGEGTGGRTALLYLPGGGWTQGTSTLSDVMARRIANRSGAVVVTLTYQKAPEHPFPTALADVLSTFDWLVAGAEEFGIDPQRIVIGGDSAGGNLAAAACLALRDAARVAGAPDAATTPELLIPTLAGDLGFRPAGTAVPAAQLLIYPAVDPAMNTRSYGLFATGHGLTASRMVFYWNNYIAAVPGATVNPLVAPARAADLSDLPTALVVTAGCDVLRDEGRAYAVALRAAGNTAEHWEYAGTPHDFIYADGKLAASADLVDRLGHELQRFAGDR